MEHVKKLIALALLGAMAQGAWAQIERSAAFGTELTTQQWRDICRVKQVYDALLFTTHSAAINLAYPLISRIRQELNRTDRKFMFLCGHDSNLASIGAALRLIYPETQNAFEIHTPIGSKLVFEKWSDGSETYVGINMVFAKVSQLQNRSLLTLQEPPMVLPVTVDGLTPNADGLYRLSDLDHRMQETIAEYEAIEDAATAINNTSTAAAGSGAYMAYTLSGTPATYSTHGLVIENKRKVFRK